jgi:hypothetical protein
MTDVIRKLVEKWRKPVIMMNREEAVHVSAKRECAAELESALAVEPSHCPDCAKYLDKCGTCHRRRSPDPERQARERLGMWLTAGEGRSWQNWADKGRVFVLVQDPDDEDFEGDGDTWNEAVNAALDRAEGKAL